MKRFENDGFSEAGLSQPRMTGYMTGGGSVVY